MNSEYIEQELRSFFNEEVRCVEPPAEWWDRLISGITIKAPRAHRVRFFPRTRLLLVAALISVIAIGGTIAGYNYFVKDLFHTIAPSVEDAGLATELDMRQTIGKITVKLERAYTDANLTIVGFTVDGPNRNYYLKDTELSSEGLALRGRIGLGQPVGTDSIIGAFAPEAVVFVYAFDATSLNQALPEQTFHLEILISTSATSDDIQDMSGLFAFDFTIPSSGGRTVAIGQTVEASEIEISLESVTISPWGTTAVIRLPEEYATRKGGALPICSLRLPDGTVEDGGVSFRGDFTSQSGEWTLTVKELVLPSTGPGLHPASDTQRIPGPWMFNFETE